MKSILFFSVIFFSLVSCKKRASNIDINYVLENQWLYDKGFKVGGDWLEFDPQSSYSIKKDTIFKLAKPMAIIKSTDKKNYSMLIESITTREKGVYANTEEMRK